MDINISKIMMAERVIMQRELVTPVIDIFSKFFFNVDQSVPPR